MKKKRTAIVASSVVVASVMAAAPVIPAPNGLISVAVCDTSQGEVQVQIPDSLYKRMGEAGGYAHNPKIEDPGTGEQVQCNAAYQYLASYKIEKPVPIVSSTSSKTYAPREDKNLKWREKFNDDDRTSVFKLIVAPRVEAAITFDASSTKAGGSGLTSLTWAHTNNGDILFSGVFIEKSGGGESISGITYNSVSMTQLSKQQRAAPDSVPYSYVYYLAGPATGANNIVVTTSSSSYIDWALGVSYSGAQQTGIPDSTNTGAVHSTGLTVSTTVVSSTAWLACMGYDDNGGTDLGGDVTTNRATSNAMVWEDSNGVVATGSKDCTVTGANGNRTGHVFSFIQAAAASAVQVPDTIILR